MELARVAWLTTTLACMLAAAILLMRGEYGYAGVSGVVAVSAAINLTGSESGGSGRASA